MNMAEAAEKVQRTLTGTVVSAKTAKTIAVEITRVLKHARYGKYIRRTTRLLAHDETGDARQGDTVTISPCAPVSRKKAWRLVAVIGRASAV
jgi:small subunit ribosomal protein S17